MLMRTEPMAYLFTDQKYFQHFADKKSNLEDSN